MSSAQSMNTRLDRANYPQRGTGHNRFYGPLAIGSRAPYATSALRSTTRLRSRRKSTSEVPGQSCRALPVTFTGGFGPKPDIQRMRARPEMLARIFNLLLAAWPRPWRSQFDFTLLFLLTFPGFQCVRCRAGQAPPQT
jgi:hypothetical protein